MSRKGARWNFYYLNSEDKLNIDFYGISNKIDKISIF
jgi:hypothetical protein